MHSVIPFVWLKVVKLRDIGNCILTIKSTYLALPYAHLENLTDCSLRRLVSALSLAGALVPLGSLGPLGPLRSLRLLEPLRSLGLLGLLVPLVPFDSVESLRTLLPPFPRELLRCVSMTSSVGRQQPDDGFGQASKKPGYSIWDQQSSLSQCSRLVMIQQPQSQCKDFQMHMTSKARERVGGRVGVLLKLRIWFRDYGSVVGVMRSRYLF